MPGFCSYAHDFNIHDVFLFTARQSPFSSASPIFCEPQWLYSLQEALAARGYCYSWTRCFHCLCIFLGIWITIPLWLRMCWPNEPTWLIDTGDHQSSHSSSPAVNKHWIFHPPNVCLIMDHFNPVGEKKKLYKLPTRAWQCLITVPRLTSTWEGCGGCQDFQKYEMMIAF